MRSKLITFCTIKFPNIYLFTHTQVGLCSIFQTPQNCSKYAEPRGGRIINTFQSIILRFGSGINLPTFKKQRVARWRSGVRVGMETQTVYFALKFIEASVEPSFFRWNCAHLARPYPCLAIWASWSHCKQPLLDKTLVITHECADFMAERAGRCNNDTIVSSREYLDTCI